MYSEYVQYIFSFWMAFLLISFLAELLPVFNRCHIWQGYISFLFIYSWQFRIISTNKGHHIILKIATNIGNCTLGNQTVDETILWETTHRIKSNDSIYESYISHRRGYRHTEHNNMMESVLYHIREHYNDLALFQWFLSCTS